MIISKLKLTNWKNFKSIDIDLIERVFVVGANASGKSNLLDAIRFLRDVAAHGLQKAVTLRDGVSKIRCLSARAPSTVRIELHLKSNTEAVTADWIYILEFKHSGGGIVDNVANIVEEKVWKESSSKWVLQRDSESQDEDSETKKFSLLEQVAANKSFRDVYTFLLDIQYINVVPQLLRDSDSYNLVSKKEDYYGRNLIDRMARMNSNTRNSYLSRISKFLSAAVPQMEKLSFIKDIRTGLPHLEARYNHWRSRSARQQENQFSDGTLRMIGFMWALLDGNETLLLEEPELYLHVAIVKLIPEMVASLQQKKNRTRQVILTTHSVDLLANEGIGLDEVIVLETTNEGTNAFPATDRQEIRDKMESGFNVADAVLPEVAPAGLERVLINLSGG